MYIKDKGPSFQLPHGGLPLGLLSPHSLGAQAASTVYLLPLALTENKANLTVKKTEKQEGKEPLSVTKLAFLCILLN